MENKIPGVMAEKCIQLFARGEAFDAKGFIQFFTETPVYIFGNNEPCFTKQEIFNSITTFFNSVKALYHDIRNMWEKGNVLFVEMDVIYWRHDGTRVRLPCTDTVRFQDDKIQELRIYMDANPIFNPSLPVGQHASVYTIAARKKAMSPDVMKKYFSEDEEGLQRMSSSYAPKWSKKDVNHSPFTTKISSEFSPSISRIYHFNINCKDLAKSLAFYEMLGFKKVLDFGEGMESKEMAVAFGMRNARIRGVHLRLGDDPESTRIDLLEFQVPRPSGSSYPHLSHTGIARICLKTDDIWKMYKHLQFQGVKFLSEPQALPGTNVLIVCFKDPDGIFLELLQGDL